MSKLNLNQYRAFAFDFDGTLVNSTPAHMQARSQAFADMARLNGDTRFTNISREIQAEAHRHGSNPTAIIGWTLQQVGVAESPTDSMVAETVRLKNKNYVELCAAGLPAVDGAVEFAKKLEIHKPGSTYITTTAYREAEVLPFLRHYDLTTQLPADHTITYEDVGPDHLKPDPLAYAMTLERAGLRDMTEQLLVFEDTPGGVASAKAAGATAVGLCTTHERTSYDMNSSELRPDFIVDNFDELLQLL